MRNNRVKRRALAKLLGLGAGSSQGFDLWGNGKGAAQLGFLLVVIYMAFISLGLPDSLLGSAWPAMYAGLGVPMANAGILSVIISGGTIISSLFSDRVIRRFGTGVVTAVCVAMTAAALIGISFANHFVFLCVFAVPLGLGAGSIDTALNNFVATHYKAMHMSWLHCFWGVGAALGPVIMAFCLSAWDSWPWGYRAVGVIQLALTVLLFCSLPLWQRAGEKQAAEAAGVSEGEPLSFRRLIRLPGAKKALLAFFSYCAVEATVGLWGASFLVTMHRMPEETATFWIALYYFGITAGRFIAGFLTIKMRHRPLIFLGLSVMGLGVLLLFLPVGVYFLPMAFFLIGLGCAPVFPSMIHETPKLFGARHSQSMIGLQMACAYAGTTLMPPLFGLLAAAFGYLLFPFYIVVLFFILMTVLATVK